MATNLFADHPPSENGLSAPERGLATGPFQQNPDGKGGKKAAPASAAAAVEMKYDPAGTYKTDPYPGHSGYLFVLQALLQSVKDDKIVLPGSLISKRVEAVL